MSDELGSHYNANSDYMPNLQTPDMPGKMQMSVSSFINGKKIPISAYAVDKKAFAAQNVQTLIKDGMPEKIQLNNIRFVSKFQQSLWSVAQLVLLPLWVLCGTSVAQGYELDIDVQVLFLVALVIGVADSHLDRFLSVSYTCEVLEEHMMQGAHHFLLGLTVAVQVVLVLVINFVTGWRYTFDTEGLTLRNADGPEDSIGLRTLNSWAIVCFNAYFGLVTLAKAAKVWYRTRENSWRTKKNGSLGYDSLSWFSYKSIDELQLALLLLFSFLYVFAVVATSTTTKNWFMAMGNSHGGSEGMDTEDIVVLYWKSDWTPTHGLRM